MDGPDQPEDATSDSAEERTTDDAAGMPAGDRDLDELLDDPDAASA